MAYLAHLEGLRDRQGRLIEPEGSKKWGAFLPEHFYMVEVSAPELFPASRRKFGEKLLRSDVAVDASDPSHNFLFVRLPGIFAYLSGTQIMTEPSPIQGHTPLYQAS